jgi:hypothetical protein
MRVSESCLDTSTGSNLTGFDVTYQPMGDGGKAYALKVKKFSENLRE